MRTMSYREVNYKYIWQFRFDEFSEATDVANEHNSLPGNKVAGGFSSHEWESRQINMLNSALNGALPRFSSLPEFIRSNKIENLVDFGGGPGWIWAYLVATNMTGEINYFNCELNSSRSKFEYLGNQLPRMHWTALDQLSSINLGCNFLYSNSVLQYLKDNSELLKVIETLKPISIILDDVCGFSEENFFSLQNYYGLLQVNRFVGINQLVDEICQSGYTLKIKRPFESLFAPSMVPKIWNGPNGDIEIPSSWTLVFDQI